MASPGFNQKKKKRQKPTEAAGHHSPHTLGLGFQPEPFDPVRRPSAGHTGNSVAFSSLPFAFKGTRLSQTRRGGVSEVLSLSSLDSVFPFLQRESENRFLLPLLAAERARTKVHPRLFSSEMASFKMVRVPGGPFLNSLPLFSGVAFVL